VGREKTALLRRDGAVLFIASFLSLFLELALIRWIPATIHIVGFFANLVLIGSFLGLGLGLARPLDAPAAAWRALAHLASAMAVLGVVSAVGVRADIPSGADYGLNEIVRSAPIKLPAGLLLILVFTLVTWATVPFGRLVASRFDRFHRLRAYSINIGGSLAGVLAFSLCSWLRLPPLAWFAIVVTLLVVLADRWQSLPIAAVIVAILVMLVVGDTDRFRDHVAWSPYYKVVTHALVPDESLKRGFVMDVNGQFLLSGFDLRPGAKLPSSVDANVAASVASLVSYYDLPAALRPGGRVLVLGAGAGNDVAAALRHGARSVTAVEIDPLVADMGKRFHPESPFASPLVRVVIDDARAFLNRSPDRFDVIVFGTLDAHGLLAGSANLRLDGFIYTQQSLAAARRHLAPGGVLVLAFGPFREDTQLRLFATVRQVFGQDPLYLLYENGHRAIVAGHVPSTVPAGWRQITQSEIEAGFARAPDARVPATDDWPHLYIRRHAIPGEYLGVLVEMLLIAAQLVGRTFRGAYRLNGHFFFLGAGFLLLETKSVTEFALLIGSTWLTNSAVFTVILLMILVANVAVRRIPRPPLPAVYGLLLASLCAGYIWPVRTIAAHPGAGSYALAIVFLGVPIFLAAIVFASTFRETRIGSAGLASNLLGAVFGGVTEYLSLIWGIRSLALIAAFMYGASFVFWLSRRRSDDLAVS